jgi:DeoR/GlpR family transcriptional regulator of sugar metabolism
MLSVERRQVILDTLELQGMVTVPELLDKLPVSPMTLWRDLRSLENRGLLQRVRGGALRKETLPAPEPSLSTKTVAHLREKTVIARFAVERCVKDGHTLALEGGSTVAAIVSHLKQRELSVLTNSLHVANLVANHSPRINLICSGGMYREISQTFVGPTAERFFEEMSPELLFISATGLCLARGLTDPNPLEVQTKRAMMRSAKRVVGLIDSSKIGLQSLMTVAGLEDLDVLVTDSDAPDEMEEACNARGIELYRVNTGRPSELVRDDSE